MKGRIYLKKARRKKSKFLLFVYILVFAFIISFILVFIMGRKLETVITGYATKETERIAMTILNDTIRKENFVSASELYEIVRDSEGNIQLINFNSEKVNDILITINERATERLLALEHGDTSDLSLSGGLKGVDLTYLEDGVVCDIPLGVVLNNALLVNLTASIPMRFSFIGTVSSNLDTKVTSYGINNALVEINIDVTIMEQITLPHSTKKVPVTLSVNLVTELIQGDIPNYYLGSLNGKSASLSTPIEETS